MTVAVWVDGLGDTDSVVVEYTRWSDKNAANPNSDPGVVNAVHVGSGRWEATIPKNTEAFVKGKTIAIRVVATRTSSDMSSDDATVTRTVC